MYIRREVSKSTVVSFLEERKVLRTGIKKRIKVSRIHEHIINARADYLHKLSTKIIKNHDVIGMEDLQASNMLKNRKLAKAISEVS